MKSFYNAMKTRFSSYSTASSTPPPPENEADETTVSVEVGGKCFVEKGFMTCSRGIESLLVNPLSGMAWGGHHVWGLGGASWHVFNAMTPHPRALVEDGDSLETISTIQELIEDVEKVTSIKIMDDPIQEAHKKLLLEHEELQNADQADEEQLQEQIQDLKKQIEVSEGKLKTQLFYRKKKIVDWLKTLGCSDGPGDTRITFIRNILCPGQEDPVKPSFAVGILQEQQDEGMRLLDFGTKKVAVTNPNGTQPRQFNRKYNSSGYSHEAYIDDVLKQYKAEQLVARLTGTFRKDEEKANDLISLLNEKGIQAEVLPIEEERRGFSKCMLKILAAYFPGQPTFSIAEIGQGSTQVTHYVLAE